MQAVITVVGQDRVGILAGVSAVCAEAGVNIEEVTQSILRGTFAMIMLVSLPEAAPSLGELAARLKADIYDAMHTV